MAQRADGIFQPLELVDRIVGDHALDLHARLVQHHAPHGDAVRQPVTDKFARPIDPQLGFIQLRNIEKAALGHDFRQHHGDGLQRFNLFFGVDPLGLVLHRQHAEHLAAAHNGNAQEGLERVFPGFGTVREVRVGGRVGQVHRFGGFRHHADKSLAFLQAGVVNRGAVQAFGGEQLQHLAGAAQIDGTDFRHHVGGDDRDQLVQPHLGGCLLRHDFAQAAQQQTWAATGRH